MKYLEQVEKALVALVEQWNPKANIYAVGGYVRDEIMNNMKHDLDLVIDLDGIPLLQYILQISLGIIKSKEHQVLLCILNLEQQNLT